MSKNVRKGSTCEKCVQLTEGRRVVNFLASRISCNWKGNTNDINWYSEPIPENPRIRWDHASKVKLVTWKKTDRAWVSTYQSTYIYSIHRIYTYIKSNWLFKSLQKCICINSLFKRSCWKFGFTVTKRVKIDDVWCPFIKDMIAFQSPTTLTIRPCSWLLSCGGSSQHMCYICFTGREMTIVEIP